MHRKKDNGPCTVKIRSMHLKKYGLYTVKIRSIHRENKPHTTLKKVHPMALPGLNPGPLGWETQLLSITPPAAPAMGVKLHHPYLAPPPYIPSSAAALYSKCYNLWVFILIHKYINNLKCSLESH